METPSHRLLNDLFADRRAIPPFASLRAFEAFGRLGGVRKAALELTVHHSVVSRHLHTLEEWLGLPLLDRSSSVPRLNETGRQYHKIISSSMAEMAQATRDVVRADGGKRLLVWCVPGFATRWMSPMLESFAALHPSIDVELRPTDHSPDFKADEADIDIRFVRDIADLAPPKGVEWLSFARPTVFPVASPAWIAASDFDGQPEGFMTQRLLHEENDEEWRGWLEANSVRVGARLPGPRLWHAHMTIDAARRGQGVSLANPFLIGDDLADGLLRLVTTPAGECSGVKIGAYVFAYRKESNKRATILKFRDWLAAKAAEYLNNESTWRLMPAVRDLEHQSV